MVRSESFLSRSSLWLLAFFTRRDGNLMFLFLCGKKLGWFSRFFFCLRRKLDLENFEEFSPFGLFPRQHQERCSSEGVVLREPSCSMEWERGSQTLSLEEFPLEVGRRRKPLISCLKNKQKWVRRSQRKREKLCSTQGLSKLLLAFGTMLKQKS